MFRFKLKQETEMNECRSSCDNQTLSEKHIKILENVLENIEKKQDKKQQKKRNKQKEEERKKREQMMEGLLPRTALEFDGQTWVICSAEACEYEDPFSFETYCNFEVTVCYVKTDGEICSNLFQGESAMQMLKTLISNKPAKK